MPKSDRIDPFVGTWVSAQPFDSDDYLVEYTITKAENRYLVTAKDCQDGEHFEISNIRLDGDVLVNFKGNKPRWLSTQ